MKLKILPLLIVASAICIARSEPNKRSNNGGSGNPLGIIKAELVEEDASAVSGPDMDMVGDQVESESAQRIVIKPIRKHRGKRIRIRLVNAKKPKNYVRLKVAGTKNVEQKYPGEDEENTDYDSSGSNNGAGLDIDDEGNETTSNYGGGFGENGEEETTAATDDTQNGEDAMKVKHHHHHHHHNHIKTVVKKVPEPYPVEKVVHVPVEKIVHVPKPYPVEKIIEKIVHVPKPYPVEKIVHVPKIVEKIVYSPLFGKDDRLPSSTTTYSGGNHFTDLTSDSKLKFGASGSSLDIIYPSGHTSSFSNLNGNKFNGPVNSYGKPLGKHSKFPDFEDINKQSNKVHSILDNDAFDFGDLHTSKPKDHHQFHNNGNNNKKNHKNKNKRRNNNKNNPKKNNNGVFGNKPFDDDYFSSSASGVANSHSYSGISMPSYTHEFSVSNSDQQEVIFNPNQFASSSSSSPSSTHTHHHSVHYESLPFKYPPTSVTDHGEHTEYDGHASTTSADYSPFNWADLTSTTNGGGGGSAFHFPQQSTTTNFGSQHHILSGAESAQSPIGPIFRPPRKNPAAPFHGKKGSHGAPRAGPRRPPRNNQGEAFLRAPPPPSSGKGTGAGHSASLQNFYNRPEGLRAMASNNKGYVQQSRPRPVVAAASSAIETVMMPPVTATTEQ